MLSDEFDALLGLLSSSYELIATDDDGGEGTNARLVLRLPETGKYQVGASSFETGSYELTIQLGTSADLERAEQIAEADFLVAQGIEL